MADREAKYAALSGDITFDKLPPSDLKGPIRSYVLGKWQERWASSLLANNKKYKNIRSHITPWYSSFHSNRRIEVILTRLRIGHNVTGYCQLSMFWSTAQSIETSNRNTILKVNQLVLF